MMSRNRLLYVILILATVLAVDLLFLHVIFPAKKARLLKELNRQVETSLEEHPPGRGSSDDGETKTQASGPTDFKTASQECLGKVWNSAKTFPADLKQAYKIQSQVVDIEDYHLKLPNGDERRLHVVSDGRRQRTVRWFALDSEGLPTPLPLDPELRSRPVEDIIQSLVALGPVHFHQTKERWLLGNGSTLLVTFENGEALEFQLFGPERTLSCLRDSCQCL